MDEIDRILTRVRDSCFGMLPLAVYRRIYETAAARHGTFVEIGTSQGAATIAMALGAKAAGKPFRIYSVDNFIMGSRPKGGSPGEKLAIVRRGYEAFGVAGSIENIVGTSADLPGPEKLPGIDLLLIDADGRIDRDLALLHERLSPDCPVIVDDVDDAAHFVMLVGRLTFDQKHRATHLLLERFLEAGLLVADPPSGQTGWYRKGKAVSSPDEIERLALPAYRELVYAPVKSAGVGLKWAAWRLVTARAPWLGRAWRRVRGKGPA
ncbi:MAG: class I SAM-dependent methyltransferase [Allosphingosinicella sp.]